MANEDSNVRVLVRGLSILDCFSKEKPALTLMEIASAADLNPSTTSRLIATLESFGYLKRDPATLAYSLGYKLAHLGAMALSSVDIRDLARPFLLNLRNRYNESVALFIMHSNQRICIDSIESTHLLHRVISIGTRSTMTHGASGRLLLAFMSDEFISSVISSDPSITMEKLEEIRRLGYSVSIDEYHEHLTAIAVPVRDAEGKVFASLFLSGPTFRIPKEKIPDIAMRMIENANELSRQLGYTKE